MRKAIGRALLVLVIALSMGAGLVFFRERKQAEHLTGLMTRLADEGYGSSLADLQVRKPDGLDPALQARARAWLDETEPFLGSPDDNDSPVTGWTWYLRGEYPPPESLRAWHEKHREYVERLMKMLEDERLCLSSIAWLPKGEPGSGEIPEHPFWRLHEAAEWLVFESLLWQRSGSLDALDRLHRAVQPAASFMDAMAVAYVGAARDRAILALAFQEDIDVDRVDAWLRDVCHVRQDLAVAVRYDRLTSQMATARALLQGTTRLGHSSRVRRVLDDVAYVRLSAKQDMARVFEISAMTEAQLRSPNSPQRLPIDDWIDDGGQLIEQWGGMCDLYVRMAIQLRLRHRLARLGVRILRLARSYRRRAPKDQAELRRWLGPHASLLDAGPWDLSLRYESLGRRFRLRADPDTPLPPAMRDPKQKALLLEFSPPEQPDPIEGPWGSLEIDLDARGR